MTAPFSPTFETRRAQLFPMLAADEIAHIQRFGRARRFADGERVLETGKVSPGIYVVVSGAIRVTARDAHGQEYQVVQHGPGNFAAELSQLSGKPSFVDAVAVRGTPTVEISNQEMSALLIAEANLRRKLIV